MVFALYYLAATDPAAPSLPGTSMADRLDFFAKSIAGITRAHNCECIRYRKVRRPDGTTVEEEEEYDDLTVGDEPSCGSGVRKRLLGSVVGNRWCHYVDVEERAGEFVKKTLLGRIPAKGTEERAVLNAAYEKSIMMDEMDDLEKLALIEYNLTQEDEEACFAMLRAECPERMVTQFAGRVREMFAVKDEFGCSHVIQYVSGYTNLLE